MSSAFQSADLYPELATVVEAWQTIRKEARAALSSMVYLSDSRASAEAWRVLPLLPEEEDRGVIPAEVCAESRRLAPWTTRLLESIPSLEGYALSALNAGERIRPHRHTNPLVTATLCLQSGGDAYIVVAGERRDFRDGELVIFDYTRTHEVVNAGDEDRIVLLMLLDNRGSRPSDHPPPAGAL